MTMNPYFKKFLPTLLLLALLIPAQALGIEPRISLQPQAGDVQSIFVLGVTIPKIDSKSIEVPVFEESKEFTIVGSGKSTSLAFTNGQKSSSVTFSFSIAPNRNLKPGNYRLPQGSIKIDGQSQTLKQPVVRILGADTQAKANQQHPLKFKHSLEKETPYIGEQVLYTVEIQSGPAVRDMSLETVDFPGFWTESFGNKRQVIRQLNAAGNRVESQRTALFPLSTGQLAIAGRTLNAQVVVRENKRPRRPSMFGRDSLFDFDPWGGFGRGRIKSLTYNVDPIYLNVKPLPPFKGDYDHYIPVGEMKIASSFDKKEAEVGDSLEMKITVSGEGNLSALELPDPTGRDVKNFKFYKNSDKTTSREIDGVIWTTREFDIEFVPKRAGEFRLPKIRLVSFNPKSGDYKLHSSAGGKLVVSNDPSNQNLTTQDSQLKAESASRSETQIKAEVQEQQTSQDISDPLGPLAMHPSLSWFPKALLPLSALLSILTAALVSGWTIFSRRKVDCESSANSALNEHLKKLSGSETSLDTIHEAVRDSLNAVQKESPTQFDNTKGLGLKTSNFLKELEKERYSNAKTSNQDRDWDKEAQTLIDELKAILK